MQASYCYPVISIRKQKKIPLLQALSIEAVSIASLVRMWSECVTFICGFSLAFSNLSLTFSWHSSNAISACWPWWKTLPSYFHLDLMRTPASFYSFCPSLFVLNVSMKSVFFFSLSVSVMLPCSFFLSERDVWLWKIQWNKTIKEFLSPPPCK